MNTGFFSFEDLIFKFGYVIDRGKPNLDIFQQTEEARDNDWQIYGPDPGSDQEIINLLFSEMDQSIRFELASKRYRLQYIEMGTYEVTYPKYPNMAVQEDCYLFEIEA